MNELTIAEALRELEELTDVDTISIDYKDFDEEDNEELSEEDIKLSDELFDFFQGLILSETSLEESFKDDGSAYGHFIKHCLCGKEGRKSSRKTIYYDFNDVNKYKNYEEKINKLIQDTDMTVATLDDIDTLLKYIRELFRGNKSILFMRSCGLKDSNGNPVRLGIHAFSSDVTTNYNDGNTVDLIFLNAKNRTTTLYPIDAHYLENKINNILSKYKKYDGALKFNH